jgi:hypothetical protein
MNCMYQKCMEGPLSQNSSSLAGPVTTINDRAKR